VRLTSNGLSCFGDRTVGFVPSVDQSQFVAVFVGHQRTGPANFLQHRPHGGRLVLWVPTPVLGVRCERFCRNSTKFPDAVTNQQYV